MLVRGPRVDGAHDEVRQVIAVDIPGGDVEAHPVPGVAGEDDVRRSRPSVPELSQRTGEKDVHAPSLRKEPAEIAGPGGVQGRADGDVVQAIAVDIPDAGDGLAELVARVLSDERRDDRSGPAGVDSSDVTSHDEVGRSVVVDVARGRDRRSAEEIALILDIDLVVVGVQVRPVNDVDLGGTVVVTVLTDDRFVATSGDEPAGADDVSEPGHRAAESAAGVFPAVAPVGLDVLDLLAALALARGGVDQQTGRHHHQTQATVCPTLHNQTSLLLFWTHACLGRQPIRLPTTTHDGRDSLDRTTVRPKA